MSPSESQLRAALLAGQGQAVDADQVIRRAEALRRTRRARFGSIAAVVTVVAGVGVAAGVILSSNNSTTTASNSSGSVNGTADGAKSVATSTAGAQPNEPTTAGRGGCPAALPTLTVPSVGSGPMFSAPVGSILVCIYPETGGGPLTRADGSTLSVTLTGSPAAQLAAGLNAADTTMRAVPCPLYRTANGKMLVMIGMRADGTRMAPVEAHVLQNTCNTPVTNAAAVRYNWSPPASLTAFLVEAARS